MRDCPLNVAMAFVVMAAGGGPLRSEPAPGDPPKPAVAPATASPTEADIRGWIADLGADAYERRGEATERLERNIEAARPLLEKTDSRDPEVQARIEMILLGPSTGFNERNAPAILRTLVVMQGIWRSQDIDKNGVADYWVRDVAAHYCVRDAAGHPVQMISLPLALADAAPARDYPELRGERKPRRGYVVRVLKTDQDGKPYIQPEAPPPAAENAPAGPSTHVSRFGFCAYPLHYGKDGKSTFFVTEDGVVWRKDLGPDARGLETHPAADKTFPEGWAQYEG